tara:strand:+ start:226 stop:492 length:267 start_codon:yes stop_codon:yes gene_type:complete
MSYYKDIIDSEAGSLQDKFIEYSHNWDDNSECEKKKVKIIYAPNRDEDITFEDKINSYISENSSKIKIIDIKYTKSSVMIIYENIVKN